MPRREEGRRERRWPIPYLDLSNTLFFFFVALFAIALLAISDADAKKKVDTSSRLLVTLKWQASRVSSDEGSTAAANSASAFSGASNDPTLAPKVVYPLDGVLVLALGYLSPKVTCTSTLKLCSPG